MIIRLPAGTAAGLAQRLHPEIHHQTRRLPEHGLETGHQGFQAGDGVVQGGSRQTSCSTGMDVSGSFSEICVTTIRVRLADDWIKAKDDLKVFTSIVRTWSGVVTGETGIGSAWWALENGAVESVMDEHNRRYYLQTDCFAGVSTKSLGRVVKDWKPVLKVADFWKNRYQGKPGNGLA
jgi:hypothetical protein